MPDRDLLMGTSEVVWGVTTQSNGTSFTLDFGDGSMESGMVTDQSYIAYNHTYATSGTFTATLTMGAESATVKLSVYDSALMTAYNLRNLNVNRAIENGLRFLWVAQADRASNFPNGQTTNWPTDHDVTVASFVVLSFQNNGYRLPNSNAAATGIYQKYIVQRGINYLFSHLQTRTLAVQYGGHDPCAGAGVEAAPCVGYDNDQGDQGYSDATISLALAASGAGTRTAGNFGPVNGKSYREILQRVVNSIAWGQIDGDANCAGRGGWTYGLVDSNCDNSDGSAVGWNLLAMLDAGSSGITVPSFVKPEFSTYALPDGLNSSTDLGVDGTFDYSADGKRAQADGPNLAKTAIGMQGLFYAGKSATTASVKAAIDAISRRWPTGYYSGDSWTCGGVGGVGCAYPMFNVFKALKLYAVATLPGSTRVAGPGPIPAGDWYAEYVDWFLTNQNADGHWAMQFSCCGLGYDEDSTAMALVMLSPTALVPPDEATFASVGLLQGNPLDSLDLITTKVATAPGVVVARVRSATGDPIPATTVQFSVLSGPNTGASGACIPISCVSDSKGTVKWTYNGSGNVGTDRIQANVGKFKSNILKNFWSVWKPSYAAASISLTVDVDPAVTWNAVSSDGWLTVVPASGTGSGTATVSVAANALADKRTATITLGGKTITVTQDAAGMDLTVTGITGVSAIEQGGTIAATATVQNLGAALTPATSLQYFLSTDTNKDGSDLLLASVNTAAIRAGASVTLNGQLTISKTQAAGNYFVLACADSTSQVTETDESNNCASAALTVSMATPDLQATAVGNPPLTIMKDTKIALSDTTTNGVGVGTSVRSTTRYYLSKDQTLDTADLYIGYRQVPVLASGQSNAGTASSQALPTNMSGMYYLLACADGAGVIPEVNETNNCIASASTGTVGP